MTAGARTHLGLLIAISLLVMVASPSEAQAVFVDGFDNAATVQDLLQPGRWSYIQQDNEGTTVDLSAEHVHSGAQAIRFFGHPPGRELTKADIATNDVFFLVGQTLEVEAWFYLADVADRNNITLIDAECSCGGLSSGARVMLVDDYPM